MRSAVLRFGFIQSNVKCMYVRLDHSNFRRHISLLRARGPYQSARKTQFAVRNGNLQVPGPEKYFRRFQKAIRSASSIRLPKFVFYTAAASGTSWLAHPYLLDYARLFLHLNPKDNVTAFQTSFFSFLSLIFAIYSGNTMAFLYDRQKSLMMNLYWETMALERLTEEAIHTLGPNARDILCQIRVYIDTEIYSPENQSPPLGDGSPLALIRAKARNYRMAGTDVGDIIGAAQALAEKQNERQATAVRLLPRLHWALLYIIGGLFVCTFLLFETGGGFSDEGRHVLFSVLCGLMTFVLCALGDLANPTHGIYNTTSHLDARVHYVQSLLDKYEGESARRLATRPSFSNRFRKSTVQKQVIPTSGVVGALGPPGYSSGTRDGALQQDLGGAANAAEPAGSVRATPQNDQTPPALFQLASGFLQGMRPTDAELSSSQDPTGATNGTPSHEPGERGGQVEQQRTFQDDMEKLRSHLSEAINGHPRQQQPLK
eukprot:jgi/Botrbrau1/20350/Bobra.0006s0019.2